MERLKSVPLWKEKERRLPSRTERVFLADPDSSSPGEDSDLMRSSSLIRENGSKNEEELT